MSVYSRFMLESSTGNESFLEDVDADKLMYESAIEEAFESDSYEAAMRCVSENTANYNSIMQACAISEFCYFEENGVEMVYTEGTLSDWKDSAIAFFRKVWDKIQSIFKKVLMQFSSWSKNDKDFLNKYKKKLNSKANNGFGDVEVKMYDYVFYGKSVEIVNDTINTAETGYSFSSITGNEPATTFLTTIGVTAPTGNDENDPEKWIEAVKTVREDNDKINDKLDEYRAKLAGYAGDEKIDSKEFAKEVTEWFQAPDNNRESTKDDVKLGNALDKAMKFLEVSANIKTKLNNILKTNKRSIDNAIKSVNNIYKSLNKDTTKEVTDETKIKGAKHSLCGLLIGAMKQEKNILTQYNGLALNALKACSRQSKAICVKAATYIDKDKDYKNNYQSESATSLLNSIEMI